VIDPQLLEIVVCPQCRSSLVPEPDLASATSLRCTGDTCGLVYPVRDDIPVLLIDEANH
jgi:uncharacterized protein YbaR (Trm112 family)